MEALIGVGRSARGAGRAHPRAAAGMADDQQGHRGRHLGRGRALRAGLPGRVQALPGVFRRAGGGPTQQPRGPRQVLERVPRVRGGPRCRAARPRAGRARAARGAAGMAQPRARSIATPVAPLEAEFFTGARPTARRRERLVRAQRRRQAGADRAGAAARDAARTAAQAIDEVKRLQAQWKDDRTGAARAVAGAVGGVPRAVQRRVRAPPAGVRAAVGDARSRRRPRPSPCANRSNRPARRHRADRRGASAGSASGRTRSTRSANCRAPTRARCATASSARWPRYEASSPSRTSATPTPPSRTCSRPRATSAPTSAR